MAHALNTFYCRGALGTTVNPDTIGCVWTGELDLNTLRVDGKTCGFKNIQIRVDGAMVLPRFFSPSPFFFPSSTTTESLEKASLKVPFHTNQTHFHTKGFERGLVLKLRHRATVLNIQIKRSVFPYISLLNKRSTGAAQDDVE